MLASGRGKSPSLFLKLSTSLGIVFRYLKRVLTKRDGFSFSIHICHINDDNTSQISGARSFVEYQHTPTNNFVPFIPSSSSHLPQKILKYSQKTPFCLSTVFFFFKTKPALLFLGTCSWQKSLAPASLYSRAGVCPNKWDVPVLERILLLISELGFFFPCSELFPNPPLYTLHLFPSAC